MYAWGDMSMRLSCVCMGRYEYEAIVCMHGEM